MVQWYNELDEINLTSPLCFEIIKKNHNRYFKAKDLVDEIIAYTYNIPIKTLKRKSYDFDKLRDQIRGSLKHTLHNLKEKGLIEKYSTYFWKIKEVD